MSTSGTGSDLVLQFNGQQVTVTDHFDNGNEAVEAINLDGATYEGYVFDGDYALSTDDAGDRTRRSRGEHPAGRSAGTNIIVGDTGDDLLFGHEANDDLIGGAGDDLLVGGAATTTSTADWEPTSWSAAGNDTYLVDDAGDVVVEAANGGIDSVQTDLATYTLTANVENLAYTGAGTFAGIGNELDNVIDGGAGIDTLTGGAGNDTYVVTAGDVIVEVADGESIRSKSSASYTLGAELENLTLTGNAAHQRHGQRCANTITGNSGANQLFGGGGNDNINGGGGS